MKKTTVTLFAALALSFTIQPALAVSDGGPEQGISRSGPSDRRGPPPEAFSACEGKSVGDKAQFVGPWGDTVSGTCEEHDGRLVLRPNRRGRGE